MHAAVEQVQIRQAAIRDRVSSNGVPVMQFTRLQEWIFRVYGRLGKRLRAPWFLNFVGGERFDELGLGHFENVRRIADARPDDRVLDVGCGVGRVALHFAKFLGEHGSYDGFDAVRIGVNWCNARIGRDPKFRFVHVDVYNGQYNPDGLLDAASFSFPYEDETFSLVYATSLLTHLLPDAACQYLKEISRVLEPGGRSVVTFFIIDDVSRRHMTTSAGLCFQNTGKGYWTTQLDNPEAAVAFEDQTILAMYDHAGLKIQFPIHYGTWSGRDGNIGGQDLILAIKPSRQMQS